MDQCDKNEKILYGTLVVVEQSDVKELSYLWVR